jgi:hypothetical protein
MDRRTGIRSSESLAARHIATPIGSGAAELGLRSRGFPGCGQPIRRNLAEPDAAAAPAAR